MQPVVVILAGGTGSRFGGPVPKQYLPLSSRPVIRWTIDLFRRHPLIDQVVVVINKEHRKLYEEATEGLSGITSVIGGSSRQESLWAALEHLSSAPPRQVIVHDGCRPFAPLSVLDRVLSALQTECAVTSAIPAADGLRAVSHDKIVKTIDRTDVWRIQSPRGYDFPTLFRLFRELPWRNFVAEVGMFEAAKIPMAVVPGSEVNFKITTPHDLRGAQSLIDLLAQSPS